MASVLSRTLTRVLSTAVAGAAVSAGGVCAIEMALWDLAGKAYGVPVYQMLGGKFRDKIRCYADTTESHDPVVYGQRLKERK